MIVPTQIFSSDIIRAVVDAVVKRKIPRLRRKSNPRTPIIHPADQRYTDSAITALMNTETKEKKVFTSNLLETEVPVMF
jgi:hypothetical protein